MDWVKIRKLLILQAKGDDWLCHRLLRHNNDLIIMQKHIIHCQLLFSIFQARLQQNIGFCEIVWNMSNILIVYLPCRYLFVNDSLKDLWHVRQKANWSVVFLLQSSSFLYNGITSERLGCSGKIFPLKNSWL